MISVWYLIIFQWLGVYHGSKFDIPTWMKNLTLARRLSVLNRWCLIINDQTWYEDYEHSAATQGPSFSAGEVQGYRVGCDIVIHWVRSSRCDVFRIWVDLVSPHHDEKELEEFAVRIGLRYAKYSHQMVKAFSSYGLLVYSLNPFECVFACKLCIVLLLVEIV